METLCESSPHSYRARPESGQLVEVRRRQWIVANVESSSPDVAAIAQHLVTLSSIDEDGLGEGLEVIWEIEPGAQIIERAGLPSITGQDDSDTLDAFLDAVRWGAATNADRGFLQAPFRSGVSIEDFQLDPLVPSSFDPSQKERIAELAEKLINTHDQDDKAKLLAQLENEVVKGFVESEAAIPQSTPIRDTHHEEMQ